MLGFSFYGRTEPRWLVFLCWFLFFSWPVVFMLSPGSKPIFWFSIVSGLFVVASSIKLRSVLLCFIGLFLLASYYVAALLLMGTGP